MASYRDAIDWIAEMDDTEFLQDDDSCISVTACLVRDLWDKSEEQVRADLVKAVARKERRHLKWVRQQEG